MNRTPGKPTRSTGVRCSTRLYSEKSAKSDAGNLLLKALRILSLLTIFTFMLKPAYGKSAKDSAVAALSQIEAAYQKGKLPEKVYMDSVYTTMRNFQSDHILFTNNELLQLLAVYRKIAWSRDHAQDWEHKRYYYAILSNQAQFADRAGEMLYYAEKIDALEQEAYKRPSLTALSIIGGYYETRRAPQSIANLYNKAKKYLSAFPGIARKKQVSVNDLVQAVIVLEKSAKAFYELKDMAAGKEAEALIAQIAAIARDVYKADNNVAANIDYLQQIALNRRADAEDNTSLQQAVFRNTEALLTSDKTPDYLKSYIYPDLVDWKTEYYLSHYNADSVAFYLKAYSELNGNDPLPYNKYLLNKFKARDLYHRGKYKESADLLVTSVELLDSAQAIAGKDIDDLLYANAKAEENHILLQEAEAKRLQSEKVLWLVGGLIAVLILSGLLLLRYSRRRQKARFLGFKLEMARNIHDEAGPALLYAKSLVRSLKPEYAQEKNELEVHIDHTMELVRSLSHDLKSDQQYRLANLTHAAETILDKLSGMIGFNYTVNTSFDKNRFISSFQYNQVKAILNECISNSVKHAAFDSIELTLTQAGNRLTIAYKDNGRGWPGDQSPAGIGIRNMEERCRQLNGEWLLENDFPEGYSIQLTIPLRH